MSFSALLFCTDERNSRVLAQLLAELEFQVDPCPEPFAAVKNLMRNHYDAILIDSENEQDAALLYKSVRNSEANKNALTMSLVSSQTGVAKAFRLGANLVLTTPINVDQAKGTLKVARGLLKKQGSAKPASSLRPDSDGLAAHLAAAEQYEYKPQAAPQATVEAPAAEKPSVPDWGMPLETPVPAPQPVAPVARPAVATASATVSSKLTGAAAAPAKVSETVPSIAAAAAPASIAPDVVTPVVAAPVAVAAAAPATPAPVQASTATMLEEKVAAAYKAEPAIAGKRSSIYVIAAVLLVALAGAAYFMLHRATPEAPVSQPVAHTTPASASTSATSSQLPVQAGRADASSKPMTSSISVGNEAKKGAKSDVTVIIPNTPSTHPSESAPVAETAEAVAPPQLNFDSNSAAAVSNLASSSSPNLPKASNQAIKTSQGVSQAVLLTRVDPIYPRQAAQARIEGAVSLMATIDAKGNVSNVKVVRGDKMLAEAAATAVRKWKYRPYYLNNEPIEMQTQITLNFKLP